MRHSASRRGQPRAGPSGSDADTSHSRHRSHQPASQGVAHRVSEADVVGGDPRRADECDPFQPVHFEPGEALQTSAQGNPLIDTERVATRLTRCARPRHLRLLICAPCGPPHRRADLLDGSLLQPIDGGVVLDREAHRAGARFDGRGRAHRSLLRVLLDQFQHGPDSGARRWPNPTWLSRARVDSRHPHVTALGYRLLRVASSRAMRRFSWSPQRTRSHHTSRTLRATSPNSSGKTSSRRSRPHHRARTRPRNGDAEPRPWSPLLIGDENHSNCSVPASSAACTAPGTTSLPLKGSEWSRRRFHRSLVRRESGPRAAGEHSGHGDGGGAGSRPDERLAVRRRT
jgi:hypothetical protein